MERAGKKDGLALAKIVVFDLRLDFVLFQTIKFLFSVGFGVVLNV